MANELSPKVLAAIGVTAEVCGTTFTPAAAQVIAEDLAAYPEPVLLAALNRCRRELTGRLTLAAIIERIDDGRPTADEAWAQVATTNEDRTLVSTDEAFLARGEVSELLESDEVGARMAFRDAYKRIVTANRAAGIPPTWRASLGHDRGGREVALAEGLAKGRLGEKYVVNVLGYLPAAQAPVAAKRLPAGDPKRIAAEREAMNLQGLADLKAALAGAKSYDAKRDYQPIDWQAEEARLGALRDMGEQPFETPPSPAAEDQPRNGAAVIAKPAAGDSDQRVQP